MINRERFFTPTRMRVFGGILRQSQVDGMTALLNEWEARYPNGDPRWLAYELATTTWETAHTMQPIEEYGRGVGQPYGRPDPVTGKAYYGRGFVQLTWKSNYQKMSGVVGVDLVTHPERALEPAIAAAILFEGMEHGDFTGVGLPRYFNATTENWNGARAIINGDADADHNGIADSVDIGTLGKTYFDILKGAGA
ncbi:glycoside hydrolase family 19 protein [Nitrobacter sp.]|uniref:glycoside hydrolase family 19 protein n=1 Tax=Nitrobacter sp. TaxID=29420 RepID=UPI0029CABDB7|nr:glycoside hydrolase family 19 protein [Nitrobacter sp.]